MACLDLCIANLNCDHFTFDPITLNCYQKNYPVGQPAITFFADCGYVVSRSTTTTTTTTTESTTTTTNRISAVVAAAGAVTAIAVSVSIGVGVGVAQVTQAQAQQQQQQQVHQQVANFLRTAAGRSGGVASGIAPTPFNLLPIPVTGTNFRNDNGCGDHSIIFQDGNCYPILRRGPCPDRRHWLTVDPLTLRVIN